MASKREEADRKRAEREAERRQRFEEQAQLDADKTYAAYLARFQGMDEAGIRTFLTLQGGLRSMDALYKPKTEFERIRKLFEEQGVPFTEKNLRLASPWHAKIYCRNKLFKKLASGDWAEFRVQLAKERYPNHDALADIAPLTREDQLQVAEKHLRESRFRDAIQLFTEHGDEADVQRAKAAMLASERNDILQCVQARRFVELHERIEKLPLEMRGELRLAFATSTLSHLDDYYALKWSALVEYIHLHGLETLYPAAETLIREQIESSPAAVAALAFEHRYFKPSAEDLRKLYSHLKSEVARHGDLFRALEALRAIHPEGSDAFKSEHDELLASRRLALLLRGSYVEAEGAEFAHLPPLGARELHDHLMRQEGFSRSKEMNAETVAYFSRLIARDLAKAALPA